MLNWFLQLVFDEFNPQMAKRGGGGGDTIDSFPKEKQSKEFKCLVITDSTLQLRSSPIMHF